MAIYFPLARLIYGISVALCLVIIGLTVFLYSRPAENSYMIPLEDVKIKAKKHPADVKDSEIQKPQVALAQNKVRKIPQQKPAQPDIKMEVSYDLKAHIGMELVEVLDETIKAIERGDQEWEIEI